MEAELRIRLAALEQHSLRRSLRELGSAQGTEVSIRGRRLQNFSSNDYLGLSTHPALIEAARLALEKYGTGAGASRLVCGNLPPHIELEEVLAEWKGTEAALAFSSGYAAAVGTISALMGASDVVILDKLCHASLIDGAKLSGATLRVFPHNNLELLERHLKWAQSKFNDGRILIITESVFSMDGDRSPLAEVVELKDRFGAWLMVDEAHAVGLFGKYGRGLVDACGLAGRVEIQMGTLSKALGASGGYVCGSRALVDWLINKARSLVYSTAPAPVVAASAVAAAKWMSSGEASERRLRLWRNVEHLVGALREFVSEAQSAIIPMIVGQAEDALRASQGLLECGFLVPAIRYPTVPKGAARLRVTLSSEHTQDVVETLGHYLRKVSCLEGECGDATAKERLESEE